MSHTQPDAEWHIWELCEDLLAVLLAALLAADLLYLLQIWERCEEMLAALLAAMLYLLFYLLLTGLCQTALLTHRAIKNDAS